MSVPSAALLSDAKALLNRLSGAVPDLQVGLRSVHAALPPLYPDESALLSPRAVSKRRAEFHAGRIAARDVLAALGIVDFPLLRLDNRAPLWPDAIKGSLSHTDDIACAIALRSDRPVGVDLERNAPLSAEVENAVSDAQERRAFSEHTSPARIVFSAKESVYKCISGQVGRVVDFSEVVIDPVTPDTFHAIAKTDLSGRALPDQIVARGRVACSDLHILTYAQSAL